MEEVLVELPVVLALVMLQLVPEIVPEMGLEAVAPTPVALLVQAEFTVETVDLQQKLAPAAAAAQVVVELAAWAQTVLV
jgi:hypothetical protein